MLVGILIGAIVSGIIVAAIVIIVMRRNTQKEVERTKELVSANAVGEQTRLQTELSNSNKRIGELNDEAENLKSENKSLTDEITQLKIDLKSANTRLEEQSAQNQRWIQDHEKQVQDQLNLMREQFTNTSQALLKERQNDFAKSNTENMGNIMAPLQTELKNLRVQLTETKTASDKNISSLEGALKNMMDQSKAIGQNADKLADALKNRGKVHGDWGEQVLANILKDSGLREGTEFSCQESFKGEKGNELRPDVVVNCADGSRIIIDSKVSLTAYADYNGAENDEQRTAAIKANYESVVSHVKELASKQYQRYVENSIKYVMMFIPNEGSYILATNYKSELTMEAFKSGVIILNPTNLMLALHLVLQTWHNSRQEDNCKKIIDCADKMYDKFVTFSESYSRLGSQFETAKRTYDAAMAQLSSGKGNLIKQMDSLRELGLTTTKRISTRASKSLSETSDQPEDNTEAQDVASD